MFEQLTRILAGSSLNAQLKIPQPDVNKCSGWLETRVKSDEPPWLHRLTNKNYQSNCPSTVLLRKKLTILFIFYAQPKNYTTSGSHVNVQHGLRPVSNQMSRLDCTQWDQIAKILQKYGLKNREIK